jgi:predicted regulator of Ras-like GTPase activity (Roadblock/LC7/MglB family)
MALIGKLDEVDIVNVIELARQSGNAGRLTVSDGSEEIRLFLAGGNVVHAVHGAESGEEVVHEVLTWSEGQFEFEVGIEAPKHTISTPWSGLMLAGMQRLDEATAGWEGLDDFQDKEVHEMAKMNEILEEMASQIPGFVAGDVVGMDGLAIVSYAQDPSFDAEAAAAQFALVMKLVQRTAGQLEAGELEDNLVTTEKHYILTRLLGDGSYYMAVAVDRETSSLGNVRLMTRQFAGELWDAIPKV